MIVEKYKDSDVVRINILEIGDVFRTDSSYVATGISEDDHCLSVEQSIYRHPETGEDRVMFEAPVHRSVTYTGRNCTLDEILRVKNLSVRDKFFVVADIEFIQHDKGHKITAIESDGYGHPVKRGLTLNFYQSGFSNSQVRFPYHTGHNSEISNAARAQKNKKLKIA